MTAANALPPADRSLEIYQPDAQVGELRLWRPPEEVLIEAQQVAVALQKRIAGKKKPVTFNGEQYVENDDWQMVAHFYGYAPKITKTEFVEYGDVQGFKAYADLINERTGAVVGHGEALCLDEEENWGPRTKYEWRDVTDPSGKKIWDKTGGKNGQGAYKRERVAVGEVDTPLFQLMSMAETRACNKAMSNKLKWVVSIAGYATTPAEDMHDATLAPKAEPQPDDLPTEIRRKPVQAQQDLPAEIRRKPAQPSQTSGAATPNVTRRSAGSPVGTGAGVTAGAPVSHLPSQPTWCKCGHVSGQHGAAPPHRCACDGNQWINGQGTICNCQGFEAAPPRAPQQCRPQVISEAQARRFYALWKSAGKDKTYVEEYLRDVIGVQSDREIPTARYPEACEWAARQSGGRW